MVESKAFTCQNPSCGRTFQTPLKTLNIQQNPTEPYLACPYCLTKVKDMPVQKTSQKPVQETQPITSRSQNKKSAAKEDKSASCPFHLGYLSERAEKEQIPDGCLVCKNIVECMLKKMREEQ